MKDRQVPIITLMLLSPLTAELLSGSSPPLEFFFPLSFLFLVALYGGGVLIIRELAVKWQKGWPSILLMGAAYGIFEEGLVVKSFFDPNWMDLGILGDYGRWAGVNWVWTVWLTIFHGIVSIAVPIILFNLMFREHKKERLLSDVQLLIPGLVLVFISGLGVLAFPYFPEGHLSSLAILVVVLFVFAAYEFPGDWPKMKSRAPILPPIYFFAFGSLFMFFSFVIVYGLPESGVPPLTVIVLHSLLCLGILFALINSAGRGYNERALFALAAGTLAPLIFLTFIHEANGMLGMSAVGISYIVYFFLLMIKVWREAPEATARKIPISRGKRL
ncbi:MAG: hypothetical protein ACE5IJ_07415 [Thermoplasmata archaeon]